MKIKIEYEIKDVEGTSKKSYTKTFSQVNEASKAENFTTFAEAFLGLVNDNNHEISYVIYQAKEEKIKDGQI